MYLIASLSLMRNLSDSFENSLGLKFFILKSFLISANYVKPGFPPLALSRLNSSTLKSTGT
jgi:hypothetical protein